MPLLLLLSNILKIILINKGPLASGLWPLASGLWPLERNPNFKGGAGANGAKDYYIYKLKSDNPKPTIFTELDFKNLKIALNFFIFVDYPKLTALAEYLKGVATISNKLKIPIPWILPTGIVINQQYFEKKKTLKVKPFVYTKNLLNLTVLNKNQFNKK